MKSSYINYDIKLNRKIYPKVLLEYIDKVEEECNKGDDNWIMITIHMENMCCCAKHSCLSGEISDYEYYQILQRYYCE